MIPDLVHGVLEAKSKKIKAWPVNSNRASELGHPCLRYLVYLRTRWQERALHDIKKQLVFDDGNLHEKGVLQDLYEAGFQVIEQQRAFEWKQYQITGTLDGKLVVGNTAIPLEIKSLSHFVWKSIETAEDMINSKYGYIQRYPAQLTLYMLMDEKEDGIFILKDKDKSMLKQVNMKLDYEYGESLIKKAEAINKHIAEGTIPDRIPYDDYTCGYCSFFHICMPDVTRPDKIIQDEELELKLQRREQLRNAKAEFETLDKEIRESLYGIPDAVIGEFLIKGKWIEKKEYHVPATKYWSTTIRFLGQREGDESQS